MFKILDCTLRDGGYYNHWDFDPVVVSSYLQAMANSKIDYVELGLRNFNKPGFHGAFAYTTEEYLNRLELPQGPKYGVMVDAKTILTANMSIESAVNSLFVDASDSKVSLVRIAAHFDEVEKSAGIVKALKAKGYIVGYNLMQAGGKPTALIAEKAKIATSWEDLDILYFADSLGNMDSREVLRIISAIRQEWNGQLGIHTHNNMGKGLDNSLIAKSNGVDWVDVTVTGMGRGAGNAQTENLLAVISNETDKYIPGPVYELVIKYFEPMQKECGWGSNLLYFLGAQHNVHPTYIQNLLSDTHYGIDETVGAIEYLKRLESSSSYNASTFKQAISFNDRQLLGEGKPLSGTDVINGIAKGREVLLLTNGPGLHKYLTDVEAYIKKFNPLVIAINVIDTISSEFIDYYCISHNMKFLSEKDKYKGLTKPIILPKHRFNNLELDMLKGNELIDYGMAIESEKMVIHSSSCIVPLDLTTAYALALALNSGARLITAIGFDGYDADDVRHSEMIQVLSQYKKLNLEVELIALTPSTYPIEQGSIYAHIR